MSDAVGRRRFLHGGICACVLPYPSCDPRMPPGGEKMKLHVQLSVCMACGMASCFCGPTRKPAMPLTLNNRSFLKCRAWISCHLLIKPKLRKHKRLKIQSGATVWAIHKTKTDHKSALKNSILTTPGKSTA